MFGDLHPGLGTVKEQKEHFDKVYVGCETEKSPELFEEQIEEIQTETNISVNSHDENQVTMTKIKAEPSSQIEHFGYADALFQYLKEHCQVEHGTGRF